MTNLWGVWQRFLKRCEILKEAKTHSRINPRTSRWEQTQEWRSTNQHVSTTHISFSSDCGFSHFYWSVTDFFSFFFSVGAQIFQGVTFEDACDYRSPPDAPAGNTLTDDSLKVKSFVLFKCLMVSINKRKCLHVSKDVYYTREPENKWTNKCNIHASFCSWVAALRRRLWDQAGLRERRIVFAVLPVWDRGEESAPASPWNVRASDTWTEAVHAHVTWTTSCSPWCVDVSMTVTPSAT